MKIGGYISFITLLFLACNKPEDRSCYKQFGEITEVEYPIDSVVVFQLFKNIKYRFYQDTSRKIIVRTGGNMQNFIVIQTNDYITNIQNKNKCNYLRESQKIIEVDIHYPHYNKIYIEPTDSVVFTDTLKGNYVNIHLRNGGGDLKLNVDVNHLLLSVSYGVGSYTVGGYSKYTNLSIQNLGRGNALNLTTDFLNIYQNSNNDLLTNFEGAEVKVDFFGNGDVQFIGVPDSLEINGAGDGEVITYN
jgi:predicted nucleic-acid-binding Zn-ribbon protein